MAVVAQGPDRLISALGPLVLASASPRRAELLAAAGWTAEIAPVDIDESSLDGEAPRAAVVRLAEAKARACAATRSQGTVLAGDTLVELDGAPLGKPSDADGARAMLLALAGRTHRVLSGVALLHVPSGRLVSEAAVSEVAFDEESGGWLDAYLASGEWRGKAGAYAIQGEAAAFARLVSGELDTVVGLPMSCVEALLQRLHEETT